MNIDEAIEKLNDLVSVPDEMIIKYKGIINEEQIIKLKELKEVQYMAIEALKFQHENKAKVQALQEENKCLYNQIMENEKDYQRALKTKEVIANLQDITIRMIGSDKDTLIDKLNDRNKYFKAKVQKCIERIKNIPERKKSYYCTCGSIYREDALNIIKEELEVQENGSTEE